MNYTPINGVKVQTGSYAHQVSDKILSRAKTAEGQKIIKKVISEFADIGGPDVPIENPRVSVGQDKILDFCEARRLEQFIEQNTRSGFFGILSSPDFTAEDLKKVKSSYKDVVVSLQAHFNIFVGTQGKEAYGKLCDWD